MRTRRILLLSVLVFVLLSFSVSADAQSAGRWIDDHVFRPVGDRFGRDVGGFQSIPIYDEYYQIIDFGIFLVLFIAISTIALSKAFAGEEFKDSKNAIKALAVIIGIAMAIAALKAGLSVTFFIPFVINTIFFVCILVVYFVLLRMGMDKHKILAFLLAILITYLLFNFIGGAFESRGIDVGMPTWFSGKDKVTSSTSSGEKKGFMDKIEDFFKKIGDWFKKIWEWFIGLFESEPEEPEYEGIKTEERNNEDCIAYGKERNESWDCNKEEFDEDNCVRDECFDAYHDKFCCKVEGEIEGEIVKEIESVKKDYLIVHVVDEEENDVMGADVTIVLLKLGKEYSTTEKTNEAGMVNFEDQEHGAYNIIARMKGYGEAKTIDLTHTSRKTYKITIKKGEVVEPEEKIEEPKPDEEKDKSKPKLERKQVSLIVVAVAVMIVALIQFYLNRKKGPEKKIKDRTKLIDELGKLLKEKKGKIESLEKKAEEGFIKNARL